MLAEEGVEMAAAGETAHLGDKANGVVGIGKEACGVPDAPVVKEVADGHAIGVLTDSVRQIAAVGAEHLGQRVAVQVAVGVGLLFTHQVTEMDVK